MTSRLVIALLFLLLSPLHALAHASLYQVDLIVFTHQETAPNADELSFNSPLLPPNTEHAILLENSLNTARTPYHTLPTAASHLREAYWTLNHNAQYQVLMHYTWLQPSDNQRPIALSPISSGGWDIEGTLRIKQSNYYVLDADLLFSTGHNHQAAFVFSQRQRLKPGVVYYLDHPQAGMLITIHPLA